MANLENENKEIINEQKMKVFSKEYFKYKFSVPYLKSGMGNIWKKYILFFCILVSILVIDLVTKSVFDGKIYSFLDGFVSIDGNHHNTGAGFSLFSNATGLLLAISIICVIVYFAFEYLTMKNKRGYTYYIATSLMVAGTLGNLIDRANLGYVRDFIKLEFMDFPVFNIADCALTIGVILFAIWLIFLEGKERGKAYAKN